MASLETSSVKIYVPSGNKSITGRALFLQSSWIQILAHFIQIQFDTF